MNDSIDSSHDDPRQYMTLYELHEDIPYLTNWLIERMDSLVASGVAEDDASEIAGLESLSRVTRLFASESEKLRTLRERYAVILDSIDAPPAQREISQYLRLDRLVAEGVDFDAGYFIADHEAVLRQNGLPSSRQRSTFAQHAERYAVQMEHADVSRDPSLQIVRRHIAETSQRFWRRVDELWLHGDRFEAFRQTLNEAVQQCISRKPNEK